MILWWPGRGLKAGAPQARASGAGRTGCGSARIGP